MKPSRLAVLVFLLPVLATGCGKTVATPSPRRHQTLPHRIGRATIGQLIQWNRKRELYEVLWPVDPYSARPPQMIFLLPKSFSIPETLHRWPPRHFRPLAVLNDPGTEIGTGTGTLWIHMQSDLYWLKPANGRVLPPSRAMIDIGTSPNALSVAGPGQLFAVSWPGPGHPYRTLFLQAVGFSMPSEITEWPPREFRVVAAYPTSQLQSTPELTTSVRTLLVAPGVSIPPTAVGSQ